MEPYGKLCFGRLGATLFVKVLCSKSFFCVCFILASIMPAKEKSTSDSSNKKPNHVTIEIKKELIAKHKNGI